MIRKDFVALLNEIEKNIPVAEWKYGDMHVWPIIKKDIFFKWIAQNGGSDDKATVSSNTRSKKLMQVLHSFRYYIKLKFQKSKPVDTIYVGAAAHRVDYDSHFINRFFYPIIKENPQQSFLQFEYEARREGKNYNDLQATLFTKQLIPAFLMLNVLNKQTLNMPQWDKFVSEIEAHTTISLNKDANSLTRHLHSVYSTAQAYLFLFKKYKPGKVLSLCYYKNETLAMHYAANKLNIENIDVQHGAQGPLHVMYNFSNAPLTGYNTVPNIFWCWDKASANTIHQWVDKQDYHKVMIGGNPWIKFQLSNLKDEKLSDKKIVLYTLQEESLDPYILDAIKMTGSKYEWWLRLHPRMLGGKENIQKQLREKGLTDFVEIDKATSLPLPVLLQNSSVHISKYSGSIIEAVQVNTPNIIIDKIGVDTYGDYVQSGDAKVVISGNAEELANMIDNIS
jgi:hypothetical protein